MAGASLSHPGREDYGPQALSTFSSLTILGLASSKGGMIPVTLSRSASFPAHRSTAYELPSNERQGWESLPVPLNKPHLELELGDCLGDGRIGLVYGARISRVLDRPGGVQIHSPAFNSAVELCIKIAKPTRCRSLARELWFYERLSEDKGYQGEVVPRCYGLFTTPLNAITASQGRNVRIDPWPDKYMHAPLDDSDSETDEDEDHLADDEEGTAFLADDRPFKTDSPWNTWRYSPDSPLISLLVTEKLGEVYSKEAFKSNPSSRNDLANLIEDLSSAAVLHNDFKFNNVVRALPGSPPCSRHGYAHEWRVIDFDRASRWGKTVKRDDDLFIRHARKKWAKGWGWFWGIPDDL
ncbi:hypothetical protein Hypma_006312 [Hypsizygus marmoreus]|uniref:Protein kinase domain-containing protein n=1 Tax=Hypsizygus marmoreus TaxID=39966 RepID=A0A369JW03_HYPMA|nr:hypothetical protein Hypma_006312 [Hypsizygus marmoreus]